VRVFLHIVMHLFVFVSAFVCKFVCVFRLYFDCVFMRVDTCDVRVCVLWLHSSVYLYVFEVCLQMFVCTEFVMHER